ncbi:hypothetical protein Aduo_006505 [Ancylostoma duodenale]
MWAYIAFLSLLVSYTSGATTVVEGKVGTRVTLDLGKKVRTWMRETKDGYLEAARYCDPGTTAPECSRFVNVMTNVPTPTPSEVLVYPNGTLIFVNLTESDGEAKYYSPEIRPKVVKYKNDTTWTVLPPQIYLKLAK